MTLLDGEELAGSRIKADVCVIGGGPAGIVVAAELSATGLDVVVLEAGGDDHDIHDRRNLPRTIAGHVRGGQAGTRGRNTGNPYYPLRMSRARGVGGSTRALKEHGLRSRPLDPIDFEPRFDLGWPMPYADYAAFLGAAEEYCGIPGENNQWGLSSESAVSDSLSGIVSFMFRHGPRGEFRHRGMAGRDNSTQRWVTSAAVTGFEVDASGYVSAVWARSRSGASFTVSAPQVVLATGGIDNPRQILASEPLLESMGQSADNVGRYFMEHLHYVAGHFVPSNSEAQSAIADGFVSRDGENPWVTVDSEIVREEGLARTAFEAVPAYSGSLEPAVNAFGRMLRSLPYGPFDRSLWADEIGEVLRNPLKVPAAIAVQANPSSERDSFAIGAMSEQTPNRDSRITLSDDRDRSGLRLPELDWQLNDRDVASLRRSAEIFGEAFASAGLGRFIPIGEGTRGELPVFTGGWHHMGTTRMSAEPSDGVVDTDCRVHGVRNLFVAGSSVFPTGGFANPTLSVVALAVRLAHHLESRIA